MHILYYFVEDITRFGSLIYYETEKGEQFNKFTRKCLFRTNRHNTSRDTAVAFSKRFVTQQILVGGSWQVAGRSSPAKCSYKVLEYVSSFSSVVRNFDSNNDDDMQVKVGFAGVFRNKYNNLFIGEVCNVDAVTRDFTVVEYVLFFEGSQQVTRFKQHQQVHPYESVYYKCFKDEGGNLVVAKLRTTCRIKKNERKLVEMFDISRKHGENCLINSSKFGTF